MSRRPPTVVFLGVLPVCLALLAIVPYGTTYAFDFHVFLRAANDLLSARPPYPRLDPATIAHKNNFVYPLPVAAAFAPFTLLPAGVAAAVWSLLLLAAVPATLLVLGIRDWRCYGALLLWLPTLIGVRLGSLSPLLMLGLALLWRVRDRRIASALLLAALVVSKLFLAPLLLWFALTRRTASAAVAVVVALAASLVAWAAVGFSSLTSYPHLVALVARVEERGSFSPLSLALGAGLQLGQARIVVAALAAAVIGVAVAVARSSADREEIDVRLLIASLTLALVLSPIVWGHYLMLLAVPLALRRPAFSPLWLLPAWVLPDQTSLPVLALALGTVTWTVAACWPRPGAVRDWPKEGLTPTFQPVLGRKS